jgi:hypothetical protein
MAATTPISSPVATPRQRVSVVRAGVDEMACSLASLGVDAVLQHNGSGVGLSQVQYGAPFLPPPVLRPIQAFIFDSDGTLVNSEVPGTAA